jgi:hypothetical protein
MALIDRLENSSVGGNLPAHEFTDSLFLWAIGEITRTNVVNAWALDATDQIQLDEMAATYSGLAGKDDKNEFISKVEAVIRLLQAQKITKTQAKNFIGLT